MNFAPAGSDKPTIAYCDVCGFEAKHITQVTWHRCSVDPQYPDGYFVSPDEYENQQARRADDSIAGSTLGY